MAIIFNEAENELELSTYPFADTSTPDLLLPLTPVISDMRVYAFGLSAPAYLALIEVGSESAVFTFQGAADSGARVSAEYVYGGDAIIDITDAAGRNAGVVDFTADAATIPSWGVGSYEFSAAETELAAGVVIPMPDDVVTGFLTPDGKVFYGDVVLFGEQGVVLRESENYEGAIRVDTIGDPAAEARYCVSDNVEIRRPLLTINGLFADTNGDFAIVSSTGESESSLLRIVPTTGGVTISAAGK